MYHGLHWFWGISSKLTFLALFGHIFNFQLFFLHFFQRTPSFLSTNRKLRTWSLRCAQQSCPPSMFQEYYGGLTTKNVSKSGKFWIFLFSHQNFSKTWNRVTFKLIQYIKNCLKNNMYDFWKDMIIVSREKKCLVVKNGLFLAIFIYFLFWPPKKPFSMPISKKSQECFLLDNKK